MCLKLLVEVDPVIEVDLGLHVFGNSLGHASGHVVVLERAVLGRKQRRYEVH